MSVIVSGGLRRRWWLRSSDNPIHVLSTAATSTSPDQLGISTYLVDNDIQFFVDFMLFQVFHDLLLLLCRLLLAICCHGCNVTELTDAHLDAGGLKQVVWMVDQRGGTQQSMVTGDGTTGTSHCASMREMLD